MFRERIPAAQLSAWLTAGTVPVLLQLLSGGSWVWIGLAGLLCYLLTVLVWRSGWEPAKWQCPFLFIYIVILLGSLLPDSAECWPSGNERVLPVLILALSAWSAQKGLSAAARVGTVLFWAILILYLVVLGAGVKDVQLRWLKPKWTALDFPRLTVFLIPVSTVCLLKRGSLKTGRLALSGALVFAGAAITVGVLSPEVAVGTENAFYEMTRSINLLGVARRFEALISAGMTVGWFSIVSLLLSLCATLAQKFLGQGGKAAVWIAALIAAIMQLCGLHIEGKILILTGAVFWVGIPLLTQGLGERKKS